MAQISFTTTPEEDKLICAIVDRAERMCAANGIHFVRLTLIMDLSATHANGCPLDFAKLLAADDFNFGHDVSGIMRNIDRLTGKLGNCFVPRCAK